MHPACNMLIGFSKYLTKDYDLNLVFINMHPLSRRPLVPLNHWTTT